MKGKKVLLLFVLSVLLVSLTVSVSATTQTESGHVFKVNPLYQDCIVRQNLASNFANTAPTYYTTEAAVVEAVRSGMENREATIVVGYQGTADADAIGDNIFENVMQHTGVPTQGDYLYWHFRTYDICWETDFSTNQTVYTCTMTYLSTAEQEDIVDTQVAALLDELDVYTSSDYEKVKAIYDYLCENVTYDTEGLIYNNKVIYTAYSALVRKRAVCQGYASLFYRLALELGVDARLIAGTGAGGPHGWNIVKLGNYYYNLDATWDAEEFQNGNEYAYFLKSCDDFADHTRRDVYDSPEFHAKYPMDAENYDPLADATPARNGWQCVAGKWFFYHDGALATGWKFINGKWYYFDTTSCIMQTGWLKTGNTWYYLDNSGAMATGWLKSGNVWYYFNASGAMATGWKKIGNVWYYFQSGGAMKTGWLKLGKTWYYFNSGGAMATGSVKVGAKTYRFSTSGACLNP